MFLMSHFCEQIPGSMFFVLGIQLHQSYTLGLNNFQIFLFFQDGYTFTARLEVSELKSNDDGQISYIEVRNNNGRTNYTLHYQDLDSK